MPIRKTLKTTFAGGELADSLEGRVDISRYPTSVQEAKNFYVTRFGAMANRPGTEFIGKSLSTGVARLIPFEFSVSQTYVLEFTDDRMRVLKDGSIVLTSRRNSTYKWTQSPAASNEYYLELAAGGSPSFPGALECWENGTQITEGTIGYLGASSWAVGDNDGLGFTTLYVRLSDSSDPDSKAADYVQTDFQVDTDLSESVLDEMTYAQSADTLFLAGAFFPRKVVRSADDVWTISQISFAPTNQSPADFYSVKNGFTANDREVLYQVSAIDSDGVESLPSSEISVSLDLNWPTAGRLDLYWNMVSDGLESTPVFQWTASASGTSNYFLTLVGGGNPNITKPEKVWESKSLLTEGTIGALVAEEWAHGDVDTLGFDTIYIRTSGSVDPDTLATGSITYKLESESQWRVYKNYRGDWGSLGDVGTPWFLDDNIEPAVGIAPKEDRTPFDSTDSDSYPYAVGIYKQRLHYARTNDKPQTVFSSVVNDLTNYSVSRPLAADDSIIATLQSGSSVDEIRHLVSLNDKLLILTTGTEWDYGQGTNSDTLTPYNLNFNNQGYSGVRTTVQPLVKDNECLFVQRDGKDIRTMSYKVENNSFFGEVLTYFVPHLFQDRTIVDWCYQQHPDNVAWVVLSDGKMLSMTYIPEQQMIGFCRHETDGKFESIASIKSQGDDVVYFIARRTINGSVVRYLEKMSSRDFVHVRDARFADSALTYDLQQDVENVAVTTTETTVTLTGHGYSDGDYVLISEVEGITSTGENTEYSTFNEKYYKVANSSANAFELETPDDAALTSTDFEGTYKEGGISRKTTKSVSGLSHLEGESVAVLADGQSVGPLVVSSGSVVVSTDEIGSGVIHIGMPYTSDLKTLRLETLGLSESLQGMTKTTKKVKVRFQNSSGGKMGPTSEDNLTLLKWRQNEEWRAPNELKTSDVDHLLKSTWNEEGRLLFRQDEPLPTTILMFIIYFESGGK